MRIVAGEFGGRRLVVPRDGRVRPTADRVREAWMSIVAPELPGARVLDLFAGSGALGLEALSRGASHATFVELAPASLEALRGNIDALGVGERQAPADQVLVALRQRVERARVDRGSGHGAWKKVRAVSPYRRVLSPSSRSVALCSTERMRANGVERKSATSRAASSRA